MFQISYLLKYYDRRNRGFCGPLYRSGWYRECWHGCTESRPLIAVSGPLEATCQIPIKRCQIKAVKTAELRCFLKKHSNVLHQAIDNGKHFAFIITVCIFNSLTAFNSYHRNTWTVTILAGNRKVFVCMCVYLICVYMYVKFRSRMLCVILCTDNGESVWPLLVFNVTQWRSSLPATICCLMVAQGTP